MNKYVFFAAGIISSGIFFASAAPLSGGNSCATATPDGITLSQNVRTPVAPPVIKGEKLFEFNNKITIETADQNAKLYYQITAPGETAVSGKFKRYYSAVNITRSCKVYAYAEYNGKKSEVAVATFQRRPNNWEITSVSKPHERYTASGRFALIDGLRGTPDSGGSNWQGFQKQNMEIIIDMKMYRSITEFSSTYLQDTNSGILLPKKVEYWISGTGKDYFLVATVNSTADSTDPAVAVKDFRAEIFRTEARFVKVKAYNIGRLPAKHPSKMSDAFIFCDEIEVK